MLSHQARFVHSSSSAIKPSLHNKTGCRRTSTTSSGYAIPAKIDYAAAPPRVVVQALPSLLPSRRPKNARSSRLQAATNPPQDNPASQNTVTANSPPSSGDSAISGWREDWLFGSEWDGSKTQTKPGESNNATPFRGKRTVRDDWEPKNRDVFLKFSELSLFEKLNVNVQEEEEQLRAEARRNSRESKDALTFLGTLAAVPLSVSFVTGEFIYDPMVASFSAVHPETFEVRDYQKREGSKELHGEETKLRLLANVGEAPELSEKELSQKLHEKAEHIAHEFIEENEKALSNGLADSTAIFVLVAMILVQREKWDILVETWKRLFDGFSDTGKAFLLILVTDILLGYHSEAGWTGMIEIICAHYGVEVEEEALFTFIAIVPVCIDSYFKFWVFQYLTGLSPTARVTFQTMDRH